jgi:hypothetical protein
VAARVWNLNFTVAFYRASAKMGTLMQYRTIRGVWRPPQRFAARASELFHAQKQYISSTFGVLSKLLDSEEYDEMLAQWRLGLREIWLENGFVMTCFTPKA